MSKYNLYKNLISKTFSESDVDLLDAKVTDYINFCHKDLNDREIVDIKQSTITSPTNGCVVTITIITGERLSKPLLVEVVDFP